MGLNKQVTFSTAKLLKEKGFNIPVVHNYGKNGELGHIIDLALDFEMIKQTRAENFNKYVGTYRQISAPTIAEVVYWIYSKYDIWISLIPDSSSGHKLLDRKFSVSIFRFNMNLNVQAEILRKDKNILYFNLPENAFKYVIEYILNTYKQTS